MNVLKSIVMASIAVIPLLAGTGCGSETPEGAALPETLVTNGFDETAMDDAISRARREVDVFLEVLAEADADSFSVKAPVSDGEHTEHFWIVDITYTNGQFTGVIDNEPGIVTTVRYGQKWTVGRDEISDWMFTRGDKIHGGYTIDPLLSQMPPAEAEVMRAQLVR